ncbi:ankyrin repeat-containing domain protein [Coprinopsis sp. MPI-PUGE-AT-0042]|nr:ankyrin repeat-containing domain protein [Coprinopsis sp. MPI-PUGE-AT-0042]
MLPNARDLQIVDSTLTIVGRDVNHNHSVHYHYERPRDIWAILESIPNFRNIYHDMLSNATQGTGMWLVKGDRFRVWLEPNDIKIFWGSGIPGAGKTLLASIVIEHLETLCNDTDARICVCYVYFRYSDRSGMTVRNILEILVMQTLERQPDCQPLVEQTYARHLSERTKPTEAQLLGLLRRLTKDMAITFYILDALDEAPTKIQLAVVETLASLNVKLFITSRPLKTVEANFPEAHTFAILAQDADIDLHIATRINKNVELRRVLQADPSLTDELVSAIKHNCRGMFLHASLQLDALDECLSAQGVRDTLKAFPPSIGDVYCQTWARISQQSHKHASLAKAVLVWVINASRSMTMAELERAVATAPDTHKFEPGRLVPGTTLVSLCGGLVTVEEESGLVRLVHYTAKETLEGLLHESFPHPHSRLAAVCTTRLAECGFQNTTISSEAEFKNALEKDPLLTYASEAWAFHAHAGLDVEDMERRTVQFITEINVFPAFTSFERTFFFDVLTPLHVLGLHDLPPEWIKDTTDPNLTTKLHQQSALIVASRLGHERVVAFLLALPAIQINLVSDEGWSALMEAARRDHTGTVKLLLAHPEIQVNLIDRGGWSALMLADRYGTENTIKLLLAHPGTQVNLKGSDGWSVLMVAARHGRKGHVKLILAHHEIQVNLVNGDGWSALMMAANEGHEGTVELLLAHSEIQVNQVNNNGWSTLMVAASHGRTDIVALLIAFPGIDVNLANSYGSTALLMASKYGHEAVVKLLLATGDVDVNASNKDGDTAIKLAATEGHEAIVRMLLPIPNADTTISSLGDGHTAITAAQVNGHCGIVGLLRDFESRKAAVANPSDCNQLSERDITDEDASDSDSSEYYFDADELLGEHFGQGEAVI